jgi:beta-glucosidase
VVTDYTGIPEMIAHGMGDLQTAVSAAIAINVE